MNEVDIINSIIALSPSAYSMFHHKRDGGVRLYFAFYKIKDGY